MRETMMAFSSRIIKDVLWKENAIIFLLSSNHDLEITRGFTMHGKNKYSGDQDAPVGTCFQLKFED